MNNVIMDSQILSTLMSCPRLTDLRFNHQLELAGGKSNSLECGSLVHVILEHYNKCLIAGKNKFEAQALGFEYGKLYIKGCDDCINPDAICIKHGDEWHGLKNTPEVGDKNVIGWAYVFKTMEEYFEFYKNDSWTPLAAEEVKGKVIYDDGDLRILWKAKFDEIDDSPKGIMSTDHKTMRQRRDTMRLNNQFMGQCILLNTRNVRINKIGFQSSLPLNEKFSRHLVSYSADALAEWVNEIVPYYANMYITYKGAGYWPPNYTHCENKYGKCPMYAICDSDRNMRDEVARVEYIKGKVWDIRNVTSD